MVVSGLACRRRTAERRTGDGGVRDCPSATSPSTLLLVTVRADAREAAQIVQRLLDAVEAGELDADGPLGANLIRQLRGALTALEAIAEPYRPIH